MTDIIKKPSGDQPQGIQLNKGKLKSTASPFQQRINEAKRSEVDPGTMPNILTLMLDLSSSMQQHEKDKQGNSTSRVELLKLAVQTFVGRCNLNDTSIAVETFPPRMELALTTSHIALDSFTYSLNDAQGSTPMHACVVKSLGKIPMTRAVLV